MFSAAELINRQGLISYSGYDYLGNKLGADVKFEDFSVVEIKIVYALL